MKTRYSLVAVVLFVFLIFPSCSGSAFRSRNFEEITSSLSSFSLENNPRDITGLVLHYQKSNLDGSMLSEISIYYPYADKSETFKIYPWSREKKQVYLIAGEYDLENFSLTRLTAYYIRNNGDREEYASMVLENGNNFYTIISGKKSEALKVGHTPSFNFNFDLADLNTMFRYINSDVRNIDFGIIGLASKGFVYSGIMQLELDEEKSDGQFLVYNAGGEALNNETGTVIADRTEKVIQEFCLPLPTSAPYKSFRLLLKGSGYMTASQWKDYITEKTKTILGD
ncbi:MAG: hypothetical protein JW874_00430 [Spirochaetales bacterium]|nr:hypothetical protein [Spirochaetales bacterium]